MLSEKVKFIQSLKIEQIEVLKEKDDSIHNLENAKIEFESQKLKNETLYEQMREKQKEIQILVDSNADCIK